MWKRRKWKIYLKNIFTKDFIRMFNLSKAFKRDNRIKHRI